MRRARSRDLRCHVGKGLEGRGVGKGRREDRDMTEVRVFTEADVLPDIVNSEAAD
jgi:hypothetical protein